MLVSAGTWVQNIASRIHYVHKACRRVIDVDDLYAKGREGHRGVDLVACDADDNVIVVADIRVVGPAGQVGQAPGAGVETGPVGLAEDRIGQRIANGTRANRREVIEGFRAS